ncbi:hypothetical protein VTN00DRAFT_911 [Thermoascus crustaceus]|uniref:uncharacterized protein n=1 Tax=Thermoascus crustaceus TaxID=5088 RepID=UPI003743C69C
MAAMSTHCTSSQAHDIRGEMVRQLPLASRGEGSVKPKKKVKNLSRPIETKSAEKSLDEICLKLQHEKPVGYQTSKSNPRHEGRKGVY